MMKKYALPILCAAALFLSACTTGKTVDGQQDVELRCPETGLMHGTEKAVDTDKDGKPIAHTSLHDFTGSCKFAKDGAKAVLVNADLTFFAEHEDAAAVNFQKEVKYFVTILSPKEKILAKSVFTAAIELDESVGSGLVVESIEQRIPMADLNHAGAYKIIYGLQLSKEQLAYNRKNGISR